VLRVDLVGEVLLTGAVLRLYVRVGFLAADAPKEIAEGGAYVTGGGETSGCTFS